MTPEHVAQQLTGAGAYLMPPAELNACLGIDASQWTEFGAILRQIHATTLPPNLVQIMQRESFLPHGADLVRDLEAHLGGRNCADAAAAALATFWHERREDLRTLVARAEDLGRRLAQRALAFVLCHTDIYTNNVLLDASG